jgi:hypothetical protein
MVLKKVSSHRKKMISRVSVKATRINNQMLKGKTVANEHITRQSRGQVTSTKQYKDLIKLLK